jgi:hypothetical protein
VARVAVSYKDKAAIVTFDDSKTNVKALTDATTSAVIPRRPKAEPMLLQSVISCHHCRTAKAETMPTDACQFFYECTGCGVRLRPRQGDCCVFCYGSIPCPPIQAERAGAMAPASCCAG